MTTNNKPYYHIFVFTLFHENFVFLYVRFGNLYAYRDSARVSLN